MVDNFNQVVDDLPKSDGNATSGKIAFKAENVLRAHYSNHAQDGPYATTLILQDKSGVI